MTKTARTASRRVETITFQPEEAVRAALAHEVSRCGGTVPRGFQSQLINQALREHLADAVLHILTAQRDALDLQIKHLAAARPPHARTGDERPPSASKRLLGVALQKSRREAAAAHSAR